MTEGGIIDIYQKIFEALYKNTDHYHVIDAEDGVALVGLDADDVWLVTVNSAKIGLAET